jgi:hypothetical protein
VNLRAIPAISLLFIAACASSEIESSSEPSVETNNVETRAISSCHDWSGTCTGLPEGAACGKGGTCFADTYGVAGFCTCYTPPPPPCPIWAGLCAGQTHGSHCRRLPPTSGYGTCQPTGTSCECR